MRNRTGLCSWLGTGMTISTCAIGPAKLSPNQPTGLLWKAGCNMSGHFLPVRFGDDQPFNNLPIHLNHKSIDLLSPRGTPFPTGWPASRRARPKIRARSGLLLPTGHAGQRIGQPKDHQAKLERGKRPVMQRSRHLPDDQRNHTGPDKTPAAAQAQVKVRRLTRKTVTPIAGRRTYRRVPEATSVMVRMRKSAYDTAVRPTAAGACRVSYGSTAIYSATRRTPAAARQGQIPPTTAAQPPGS